MMEQGATLGLFSPSGAGPAERGRLDVTLLKLSDLVLALRAGP